MSKIKNTIRNSIITGLIIVIPIGATLWIVFWLVDILTPFLGDEASIVTQALALMGVIAIVGIIGWLAHVFLGKQIVRFVQSVLENIPVVNKLYKTLQTISKALSGSTDSFKQVVFFEYPYKGSHTVAFIVGTNKV